MATQEEGYDSDCFIFSTPLSSRGSTKHDPISVESYYLDRRLRIRSSRTKTKSHSPIFIDLDDYDQEQYLSFPKLIEKGQSSSSSSSSSCFDCEICVESKPVTESFRISGCSHSYCNDCVSKYIASKLQDNILSIECPVSGCSGQWRS